MQISKGIIRADILAAKQAISCFEKDGIKDIKNIAAYHLQQAAEKIIKYQIYKSGIEIDNRQIYTHDLRRLMRYAEEKEIAITMPEYIKAHIDTITDWEAGSRYDVEFSVRIDVLKKCYDTVSEWEKRI